MHRRQFILALAFACALSASSCGGGQSASHEELPPLSLDNVRRDINGQFVRVPAADGKSEPIPWVFDPFEQKEINVVDQKIEGDRATFLIDMKTHTQPRSRKPRSLSGQLRLHYRLQSGLVLRRWEIEEIENVSFTYTDEPPPSPTDETKKEGDAKNANGASPSNANANTNTGANSGDARKPPTPPPPRP
jgi:hypothetical protein